MPEPNGPASQGNPSTSSVIGSAIATDQQPQPAQPSAEPQANPTKEGQGPAPAAPAPASQAGAANRPAWKAQLPDDLKALDALDKFSTIGDLARAQLELEGKLGKAIIPPGENATAEEKAAYLKRLGRPDSPKDYGLKPIKDLPETEEYSSWLSETAHELGLSKPAVEALYAKHTAREQARIQASVEASMKAVKDRWGASYDNNVGAMKAAVAKFGDQELLDEIARNPALANSVPLAEFLAKVGAGLEEPPFVGGAQGGVIDESSFDYPGLK